jgi:hypothetical protein
VLTDGHKADSLSTIFTCSSGLQYISSSHEMQGRITFPCNFFSRPSSPCSFYCSSLLRFSKRQKTVCQLLKCIITFTLVSSMSLLPTKRNKRHETHETKPTTRNQRHKTDDTKPTKQNQRNETSKTKPTKPNKPTNKQKQTDNKQPPSQPKTPNKEHIVVLFVVLLVVSLAVL